jgi:antitoxin (DNA-binding transcriptional repressor) of toxin-antitoxin stability system
MKRVDLAYAQTHLDELVEEALSGEEVVISGGEDRTVRLTAVQGRPGERVFGLDRGKIILRDDFDEPMPELEALFYGDADPP